MNNFMLFQSKVRFTNFPKDIVLQLHLEYSH